MNRTNIMGLKVVGITAAVFVVLFALYWGGRTLLTSEDEQAGIGMSLDQPLSLEEKTRDSDGDGMADLYETEFYRTDPERADTDGDGMSDRDEIIAARDPLVPGPNDEIKPATGSKITKIDTFTRKYLASLPEDAARSDVLDQVRLEAFIEQNRGDLLPEVSIKTSAEEGKEAVAAYLDAVSSTHNDDMGAVTSTDIEAAFRLLVNTQDTQPMQRIVDILKNNVAVLEAVAAPAEVADLHTSMVAATKSLQANSELVLFVNQDFVGGLIGAKNIEDLGEVFQKMSEQIKGLEDKYGLE
jgi:hypothetical protein